jgi:polysaccharide biosynthesis transport protein
MSNEYQLTFHDYLLIARRWAPAMILTFLGVLATSVVVAFIVPHVYESTGTMAIEAPQVSDAVLPSSPNPAQAQERIQTLRQRIMTRENLLRIANEYQLFTDGDTQVLRDSDVVEAMRASVRMDVVAAGANPWDTSGNAVAVQVAFQHGDPAKAQQVVAEFIALFLQLNSQSRVDRATRTTEFLSAEADKLRSQLEDLERQIAAYKLRHGSSLPENQAVGIGTVQRLESELRDAERQQRAALDELRALEVELAGARGGVAGPGVAPPAPTASEQELERGLAELARLRGIYTEDHPDVRAQSRRVAELQRTLGTERTTPTPSRMAAAAQAELAVSRLEARMATVRAQADLMASQQRNLRANIAQIESQLLRAPQVERGLAALQRDLQSAQSKYDEIRARQLESQVTESIEEGQKGERFSVLEPPLVPEDPIKPNRKKIAAMGFFLAIAAAGAVALVLEKLFARVRGSNAVAAVTGHRPLVAIPYIVTESEIRHNRLVRVRALWGIGLFGLLLIFVFHVTVMPLQSLMVRLISSLG